MLIPANATTSITAFVSLVMAQIQPTTILILCNRAHNPKSQLLDKIVDSMLSASRQSDPLSALVLMTAFEMITMYEINQWKKRVPLFSAVLPASQLLIIHIFTGYANRFAIPDQFNSLHTLSRWDVYKCRHLFLVPSAQWLSADGRFEVHQLAPDALVAQFQSDELVSIAMWCHGSECSKGRSLGIEFRPPNVNEMPLCSLTYVYSRYPTAEITVDPELGLLQALESHWRQCFSLRIFQTLSIYFPQSAVKVQHACAVDDVEANWRSAVDYQTYPICTMVHMEMKLVADQFPMERRWTRGVPWTWRSYSMVVPNWWHWRQSRSAAMVSQRSEQACWAIAGSLLCWLALITIAMLGLQDSPSARDPLLMMMWARLLAVSAPEPRAALQRLRAPAVAMLVTTVLGMWNAVSLTGALFDLRLGAAEWRPVFETLADVRAYGRGLRVYTMDLLFQNKLHAWLEAEGLSTDQAELMYPSEPVARLRYNFITILQDGTEAFVVDGMSRHLGNGSRVFRKISDQSLLLPVEAHINPDPLYGELSRVGQLLIEAGLAGHLLRLQTHWKRVNQHVSNGQWSPVELSPSGEQPDDFDELMIVLRIYPCLMAAIGVTVYVIELLVARMEITLN